MIYSANSQMVTYLTKPAVQARLAERAYLIQLLMVHQQTPIGPYNGKPDAHKLTLTPPEGQPLQKRKVGDIVTLSTTQNKLVYGVVTEVAPDQTSVTVFPMSEPRSQVAPGVVDRPFIYIQDGLTLNPGMIANHPKSPTAKPIVTSVGLYVLNYNLLVVPFGVQYPYRNDTPWNLKAFESTLAKDLLAQKTPVSMYHRYMDQLYWLGHFGELCVPTYTEKSLQTDPKIAQRRKELLKQHEGHLDDPEVMSQIETELIDMDKAWLKSDDSMGFYTPIGKKAFNIHRKKLYLTVGGVNAFKKGTGEYDFIKAPLSEGWDASSIQVIANETRQGSYMRGVETQNGGALTKEVTRVFQDVQIVEDDCKTKRGLVVDFSKYPVDSFLGQWAMIPTGLVAITQATVAKFDKRKVMVRSPLYCKTRKGYCKTCMGTALATLGDTSLGPRAVNATGIIMYIAMQMTHGSKLELIEVDPFAHFVEIPA